MHRLATPGRLALPHCRGSLSNSKHGHAPRLRPRTPRQLRLQTRAGAPSQPPGPQGGPPPRQPSLASWAAGLARGFLKCMAVGSLATALLAALLPSLLSTRRGTQAAAAIATRLTPGVVHIEQVQLGWTKPVRLAGLSFSSPSSEQLASLQSLSTTASLWQIARGRAFDAVLGQPWLDCSLGPSGLLKWAELALPPGGTQQQQQQQAAPEAVPLAGGAAVDIPFTAEGQLLQASVYVADGRLTVPSELREVVGRDLHISGALGASSLQEAGEDLGVPTGAWVGAVPTQAAPAGAQPLARRHGGERPQPAAAAVRSEHLEAQASGWLLPGGRLLLRQPATAELAFTPALAKHGLRKVSPLLSGVLGCEEAAVKLQLTTPDMALPADSYSLRLEPLQLTLQREGLLARALDLLQARGRREGVPQRPVLQGSTTALQVQLTPGSSIRTERLDLTISRGAGTPGLQLSSWGELDPGTGEVRAVLGIPAASFGRAGGQATGGGDWLLLPIRGAAGRTRVEWSGAGRRLVGLAAESARLRSPVLQGILQAWAADGREASAAEVPPLPEQPEAAAAE